MTRLTSKISLVHAVVAQAISPNDLSTHKIEDERDQKTNSIFVATMASDGSDPNATAQMGQGLMET